MNDVSNFKNLIHKNMYMHSSKKLNRQVMLKMDFKYVYSLISVIKYTAFK